MGGVLGNIIYKAMREAVFTRERSVLPLCLARHNLVRWACGGLAIFFPTLISSQCTIHYCESHVYR